MKLFALGKYCNDSFREHSDYCGFNNDLNSKFHLKKEKNAEDYEKNFEIDYIEDSDCIVYADAADDISAVCLKIFEKSNNRKIAVLLLKDEKILNRQQKNNQRIFCNVLQEYSRNGDIDRIFLLSLTKVLEQTDFDISEFNKYINTFLNNSYNLIQFLYDAEPFYGKKLETKEISRISTIGFYDNKSNKLLFDLNSENVETHYIVLVNKNDPLCKNIIKFCDDLTKIDSSSYEIHIVDEPSVIFSINSTHVIQHV